MTVILPGGLGQLYAPLFSAFDPANTSSYITLSNNNLTATGNNASQAGTTRGTRGLNAGKHYFELTYVTDGALRFGFCNSNFVITNGTAQAIGSDVATNGAAIVLSLGGYATLIFGGVSGIQFTTLVVAGMVYGLAVDLTGGNLYFSQAGVWLNGSGPTGAGDFTWTPSGTWFPAVSSTNFNTSAAATLNVGKTAFSYGPPSGFVAWG